MCVCLCVVTCWLTIVYIYTNRKVWCAPCNNIHVQSTGRRIRQTCTLLGWQSGHQHSVHLLGCLLFEVQFECELIEPTQKKTHSNTLIRTHFCRRTGRVRVAGVCCPASDRSTKAMRNSRRRPIAASRPTMRRAVSTTLCCERHHQSDCVCVGVCCRIETINSLNIEDSNAFEMWTHFVCHQVQTIGTYG